MRKAVRDALASLLVAVVMLTVAESADAASAASSETPAGLASFTTVAVADAYVNSQNPDTNYGKSSQVRADLSPMIRSYIRFDVSGVTGPITAATLRLYAQTNQQIGFEVREADDSWGETTLTYASSPTPGGLIRNSGPYSEDTWLEIDVASYITGNGRFSLAVTPLTTTNLRLDSRETANPPQLVIQQDVSGNHAPSVDDLTMTTDEDTAGTWTPAASDPDGDSLMCAVLTQPGHGMASVSSDCLSGGYTPSADYAGQDTFVYEVSDGSVARTGTVTVTVDAVNDSPVADAQSVKVTRDIAKTVTVTGSDVDGDCPLTFAVATTPAHGSLSSATREQCDSGAGRADILYTPDAGYVGADSFTVTVTDPSSGRSTPAQVSITVQSAHTFVPVSDISVYSTQPDGSYGDWPFLNVDGSPDVRSYLRFDVAGLTGGVKSAVVRVHAGSNHSAGFNVATVADVTWVDWWQLPTRPVTYNNAPEVGAVVGSSGPFSTGTWVEIDVSSQVTGNGSFSFALTPITNTNLRLDSRETAYPPELVIEPL